MMFKTKKLERILVFLNETRDGIISYCKINHPDEMILILKGHSKKGKMFVEGLVVPPFHETGPTFAGFPANWLRNSPFPRMQFSHQTTLFSPSSNCRDGYFLHAFPCLSTIPINSGESAFF